MFPIPVHRQVAGNSTKVRTANRKSMAERILQIPDASKEMIEWANEVLSSNLK